MRDLWGFLLQTLTVSGAAVLVLVLRRCCAGSFPPGGRQEFGAWWEL